jgi:hypothetical protein
LININKKTKKIIRTKKSYLGGKILKKNGNFLTQSSQSISPSFIAQGLFDSNGYIEKTTQSKMVQGYLSNGDAVYFDVNSSYSQAQLYVGERFYSQVNSSVYIDAQDNLYYFKQKGKRRILYKNKTPLYKYSGYYGIISDVDSYGNIYFIANSKLGATLFRYKNNNVMRVSSADNIRGAKLINDKQLLISAISEKDYYYVINNIVTINQQPYDTKLFFEEKNYYKYKAKNTLKHLNFKPSRYSSWYDMHYVGSDLFLDYNPQNGINGLINLKFSDPLAKNAMAIYGNRDIYNTTLLGIEYGNAEYPVNFNINGYKVLESNLSNQREYGMMFDSSYLFYKRGYISARGSLSYYQDYELQSREPISATFTFLTREHYGNSMYMNALNMFQYYAVIDRGDLMLGFEYKFKHHIANEFYLGLSAKYSKTSANINKEYRGVKISPIETLPLNISRSDPSTISMPIQSAGYVKSAGYSEISLAKVFNYSGYFFTFPISIQRESIYAKYRYYSIKGFSQREYNADEYRVGTTVSTVYFNSIEIPINIEYIYNNLTMKEYDFRFSLGSSF